MFLRKISLLLAYIVTDFYEPIIIQKFINSNYFYFTTEEKRKIYNMCLTNIDFSSSIIMINIITNEFFKFFQENKYVILDGFVNFKLKEYLKELDSVVDMCVNKFIIEREYNEFIMLLKDYIQNTPSNTKELHLIYKNEKSVLLDENMNPIEINKNAIPQQYLSDITFSSNDLNLNAILTLLPETLFIHSEQKEDDFINTLKIIFENRVEIVNNREKIPQT